ncbi:MAG: hypothetical protein M1485_01150 [Chloroflexi bacterium]|nr:hypothetical protein [Chloroflexota bacterium]
MNIKDLIQSIRHRFQREQELPDEVVKGFLRVLDKVRKEETTCNEVFAQLDEYVEKEVHGKDAAHLMPLLREHLDICSHCCDEYEALLDVLEETAKE